MAKYPHLFGLGRHLIKRLHYRDAGLTYFICELKEHNCNIKYQKPGHESKNTCRLRIRPTKRRPVYLKLRLKMSQLYWLLCLSNFFEAGKPARPTRTRTPQSATDMSFLAILRAKSFCCLPIKNISTSRWIVWF